MNRIAPFLLVFVVMRVCADDAAILDKDLRTIMQWFSGVFDNREQVYFEAQQEVDQALRHEHIRHIFASVDLPAFGEQVFYVQQHLNDDQSAIYHQRFSVFRPDYDENAARVTIHVFHDGESIAYAHLDPGKLSGLLPEQTRVLLGCDVIWPCCNNQPSIVLYACRPGGDRAVPYAWADPAAQRIDVNLRWMQASCTLASL